MENTYSVYTRKVNNQLFYFVKHHITFMDIEDTPQILSGYGMHRNFFKACSLANIFDEAIINELSTQVYLPGLPAKVISFDETNQKSYSLLKSTQNFLSKLRIAGLNYFV